MALYALGDPHLSLTVDKPMDVFGGAWEGYVDKLREGLSVLREEDTIVLCGDISWGMSLEQAERDFAFLEAIPGRRKNTLYGIGTFPLPKRWRRPALSGHSHGPP